MLYKPEEKFMKIGIIGDEGRELFKSLQAHVEGLTVSGLDYEVLVIDAYGSRKMLNSEYQAWLAQGSEQQGHPVSAIDLMHPPVTRLIATEPRPNDYHKWMFEFLQSDLTAEQFFLKQLAWGNEQLTDEHSTNQQERLGHSAEMFYEDVHATRHIERLRRNSVHGARTPASKSRLMGLQLLAPTGPQDPHGYRPKIGKGQRKANRANRWG